MKVSVAAPTVVKGTAKDWETPRQVRCLLELHVEVPEFSASELQLAYRLPSPGGGKTLFRRSNGLFATYDASSWEAYGYYNPGVADRVQHAVLSFGAFGETPADRYWADVKDRMPEIWPTAGSLFMHEHGFEPFILSHFKIAEDVGFHDVPEAFMEARREALLGLVPELILVDGTLYGRHAEPIYHYWSDEADRPVPLKGA